MKKLIKKVLFSKREKLPVTDHVAILISRLCDPTDPIYDENFARGFEIDHNKRNQEKS
jgi:hypothetical protein